MSVLQVSCLGGITNGRESVSVYMGLSFLSGSYFGVDVLVIPVNYVVGSDTEF